MGVGGSVWGVRLTVVSWGKGRESSESGSVWEVRVFSRAVGGKESGSSGSGWRWG